MNLTEMTARVRQDLKDTDTQNYLWTDGEIEGAINRALHEYSLACPIQQQTDIATTSGSTELNISSLSDLLKIESIEFPIGAIPPYYQHFSYWAGKAYMEDAGNGQNARVRWLKKHSITAQSSTVPAEHEEIIVLGATAYLAHSASAYIIDRATISGRWGTQNYRLWARERLRRFDLKLSQISEGRRVVRRTFYAEDD